MILKNETRWYTVLSIVCFIPIAAIIIFSTAESFEKNIAGPAIKNAYSKYHNHTAAKKYPVNKTNNTAKNNYNQRFKHRFPGKTLRLKEYTPIYNLTNQNIIALGIIFLVFLVYAGLFISGCVNLFIFIIKAVSKTPLTINSPPKNFSLSSKDASMLIFAVTYLYLITCLIPFAFSPKHNTSIDYLLTTSIILSILFYTFIIISVLKVIPFKNLGVSFSIKHIVYSVRVYSMVLVIQIITILILYQVQKTFSIHFNAQPIEYAIVYTLKEKFLLTILVLVITILGPISEELLFRGIIYNYLRERIQWKYAALLTSLLFAFMHANLYSFFLIFILSIGICYVYEKSNNIVTAFAFHIFNNTLYTAVMISTFLLHYR